MKRFFQLGMAGLAATAAVIAPLMITAANAQDFPILEALDLTEDQQDEVQNVLQDLHGDMDEILTDEQQQQFQEAYRERRDFREAAAEIDNLTEDQKAEIRTATQDSREALDGLLTDEQRSDLRTIIQERRGRRR